MGRFTTLIGTLALVLALAACSGSASPVPTPVPATAKPVAATPAPVTAAPTTTPTPTAQPIDVTVTFDGTNCTYAGPAVVPDGTRILFSLTLKKYQIETGNRLPDVLVGPVVTGTTWDKAKAVGNLQSSQPDWLISFQEMLSTGSWVRLEPSSSSSAAMTTTSPAPITSTCTRRSCSRSCRADDARIADGDGPRRIPRPNVRS